MNYYVYEILINDEVVYVGSSQSINEKYSRGEPKRYKRLIAHGFFLHKEIAKLNLNKGKFRYKKEILEAIVENKKLSLNIVGEDLSPSEAGKMEADLIKKYGIKAYFKWVDLDENDNIVDKSELVSGQLINKIHAHEVATTNRKGNFNNRNKKWWFNLSEEEKAIRKKVMAENLKIANEKFKNENPKAYEARQEKWRNEGIKSAKNIKNNPERLKQMSDSLKRRWARNESWIPAKNEQSRQFLKRLNATPEAKERSRKTCIERNKNPEWQLQKVKKLYFAIIKNNKNFENWKESYKELVSEGLYPQKSFRDWKKYFKTKEDLLKYCYEN